MGVTVYCGCVWGKISRQREQPVLRLLRSLVLGMLGHGWAGMLWLVDKRQQEGGGADERFVG